MTSFIEHKNQIQTYFGFGKNDIRKDNVGIREVKGVHSRYRGSGTRKLCSPHMNR